MAFCGNCGAQLPEGAKFCISCGNAVNASSNTQAEQQYQQQQQQYAQPQYQEPVQSDEAADIANNKGISVLSYIGPLVLVPLLSRKQSKFAQFHAKQGLNLLALNILCWITTSLLGLIKVKRVGESWGIPYEYSATPWWVGLISVVISVGLCVLVIIGIVNAAKGRMQKLPLIGEITVFDFINKKNNQ